VKCATNIAFCLKNGPHRAAGLSNPAVPKPQNDPHLKTEKNQRLLFEKRPHREAGLSNPAVPKPQNGPHLKTEKNQRLLFEKRPPSSGRVIKPGGSKSKIERQLQRKIENRRV
jgi:hypothetical protein